jgi:hypothetical protein
MYARMHDKVESITLRKLGNEAGKRVADEIVAEAEAFAKADLVRCNEE